jgi:hypothetical protein
MSIIKLQQAYADTVLAMIEHLDPFAIIAGGAPRDWYLGREATDLDVYFHPNPSWNPKIVKAQIREAGFELLDRKPSEEHVEGWQQYLANECLKAVYTPVNTAMKVQLMWMSEPTFESVLPQFTLNLSRAYYKSKKITTDSTFDFGVRNKAIIRTNSTYIDNDRYIDKIRTKFPEYSYYSSKAAYFDNEKAPDNGVDDEANFGIWVND